MIVSAESGPGVPPTFVRLGGVQVSCGQAADGHFDGLPQCEWRIRDYRSHRCYPREMLVPFSGIAVNSPATG